MIFFRKALLSVIEKKSELEQQVKTLRYSTVPYRTYSTEIADLCVRQELSTYRVLAPVLLRKQPANGTGVGTGKYITLGETHAN